MPEDGPFDRGYWKPPPVVNRLGSDDYDSIFISVGRALNEWESVEEELVFMFQILCDLVGNPSSSGPVLRAFGSLENQASKFSALEAAAEIYFGEHWDSKVCNIKKTFDITKTAMQLASYRRNEIAHCRVNRFTRRKTVGEEVILEDQGIFLHAPSYKTRSNRTFLEILENPVGLHSFSKYLYTAEDIMKFVLKFSNLCNEIGRLAQTFTKNEDGLPQIVALNLAAAEAKEHQEAQARFARKLARSDVQQSQQMASQASQPNPENSR